MSKDNDRKRSSLFIRLLIITSLFLNILYAACDNYQLNLLQKTYDLSDRVQYIDDHAEFETVLSAYQDKEIGRGFTENIDGSLNPFSSQQDDFLSQFTGYLDITTAGTYTFAVDGDDAVEVLIDDVVVASWYGGHGACNCQTHTGSILLSIGKHKVEFHHHERGGRSLYKLYWKKPGDAGFEILPSGNFFHCSPKQPLAEYKFDECNWSGIVNEVKDSSSNYNATATNTSTTASEKVLARAADFSTNSNSDYITLNPAILDGKSDFSIAMWIKGNGTEDQSLISMANARQNNEALMFIKNSGTRFSPHIKGTRTDINIPDITDDTWHHLVWERNGTSGENCLIIDGNVTNKYCGNNRKKGPLSVTGFIVAQDQDSVNGGFAQNQDFEGYMDELKIYDSLLSDSDITTIYENELSGYSYDGAKEKSVFCSVAICSNYSSKLNISTYDLTNYGNNYIDNHTEFNSVIATYKNNTYKFGSGLIAQINTQGSNNNPFGVDEKYLTIMDGYINIPNDGNYTFAVNGDDSVEALIDGVVVSSWYGSHARANDPTNDSRISKSTIELKAGYHQIEFRHQEVSGSDNYELYWDKDNTGFQIIPSSNFFHCLPYPPLFEYRFDECYDYNGTIDEVKDSSGNNFHGTTSGNIQRVQNGVMNSGVLLGLESNVNNINAIVSAKSPKEIGSQGSISFWYKSKKVWNASDGVMLVDATKGNKYFFLGLQSDGRLKLWAEDSNDRDFQSHTNTAFNFGTNEWVHIAMSWDYIQKRFKLYVNGSETSLSSTPPFTGVMPDLKPIHIGDISENYTQNSSVYNGVKNSANGYFDEFRAYQGELKATDVLQIYENELAGKNFDGSLREKPFCVQVQQCYADTFNRADLGDKWTIINKVNYTPQISSDKLMLTNLTGSSATAVMLAGEFPSANNYIEIEFEHNAYGGSGADGMTISLADSAVIKPLLDANVSNIAGAFGGSLGYAQRNGYEGFKGGWLGFGLDEYGNFSNPTEGRIGGIGLVKDSISVRGHGIQNGTLWNGGYEYLTGTSSLSPEVDKTPQPNGYMYKLSIDTRDPNVTLIKVERDIKDGNGYTTLIDWFDASQNAINPKNFKLAITGSTGGANNYHAIDNLTIRATGCGTLGQNEEILSAIFDAWDTFKDINTRTISTKKSSQNFDLSIAALNDTNSALQDYNGSVCVRVIDNTDNNLSNWVKLQFNNEQKKSANLSVAKANKDARVQIVWKDQVTETCPLSNETNSTKSTDNFAIRPDKFNLTLPAVGYAGENFNIDFNANSALDYNETLGTSFTVESNISKSACFEGTLHVTPFSFANGIQSADANYSDVGDINVTIKEINGSEFALVDSSDTSDIDRLITPATKTMAIKPYELNVTNVEFNTSTGQDWLYMADVNDLNQRVKATIVANDKQHNLVQNFTDTCYAQDVNVKSSFAVTNTNSNVVLKYDDNSTASIDDINKTVTIPKASFLTSQANLDYSFNIQRDSKIPYNPIMIGLRQVDITITNIAKIENNATVNKNTDFYYGRVKVEDVSTNKQSVPHSLHVEVYDSANSLAFKQNSLHWYVNEKDNDTNVTAFDPQDSFTFTSTKTGVNINSIQSMQNGVINFSIGNSWLKSDSAMIHLDIPMWLWYSKYNSYNSANDCSTHPCFEYRYIDATGTNGIQSGIFKGSNIGRDYNATKQKIGVKTFR